MTDAADTIPNRGYHAHIYYDPARTRSTAERLCAVIGEKFKVEFGGFRDGPVGPHPVANAQVIFRPDQFQPVVEWHAAPRRPRRADPPADGRLGRRPQHLRDVARLAGAAEARGVAAQLSRRAATERLSDRLPAGVLGEGGGSCAQHSQLLGTLT